MMREWRGKASGEDDATKLSSFPVESGAARAECAGLQPGQLVAAAGVAQTNRALVRITHDWQRERIMGK